MASGRTAEAGECRQRGAAGSCRVRNDVFCGREPVSGQDGSWTRIDAPAHGQHTVGAVRACPQAQPGCFVMDTIPHSTMGDLVVGTYDLSPSVPGGVISGNAFIYNMSAHLWTLLQLGGSLSSDTTLYGIWQDGGPASADYTLACGSSADGSSPGGNQRAFLMTYNERTGAFGISAFYTYGNAPALFTHFQGITGVPGGFNLVVQARLSLRRWRSFPLPAASSLPPARRRGIPSMSRQARCARVAAAL